MNRSFIKKELGRRIRKARNKKRITQDVLAESCGMRPAKMGRLESGLVNPALTTLIRISRRLNIRLDRLLRGIS